MTRITAKTSLDSTGALPRVTGIDGSPHQGAAPRTAPEGARHAPASPLSPQATAAEQLDGMLQRFVEPRDQAPTSWSREFVRALRQVERDCDGGGTDRLTAGFLTRYLGPIRSFLLDLRELELPSSSGGSRTPSEQVGRLAATLANRIWEMVERDHPLRREPVEVHSLPLANIARQHRSVRFGDGEIIIRSPATGVWHSFPLPTSDNWIHKGGLPRLLTKIVAGANPRLIAAELPANDLDAVALRDVPKVEAECLAAGIGADGIEYVKSFDFASLTASRDMDLNGCFLTKDELVFSNLAFASARSGRVRALSSERGIYGSEVFIHRGVELVKARGLIRLMKAVAEGKAESFDLLPRNKQVDLGIYWLVLARKFAQKENAPVLFERLRDLGVQTGSIGTKEPSIFRALDRAHSKYPFFEFEGPPLDQIGVARWLAGKLVKQIHQVFRRTHRVPAEWELQVEPGDTTPFTVRLSDASRKLESTPSLKRTFEHDWHSFLARCRGRNAHRAGTLEVISKMHS